MGHVRKALLIGIGHAPSALDFFDPLDEVVEADLRLMNSALDAADYDVETLLNAGLSQIRTKIFEVARDVPDDGVLLIYFSGHGVRVDGNDYLVPFDARIPDDGVWQEPYVASLLPASISPSLKACTAATVLWVIDACRTELQGGGTAFGNNIDNGPPSGGFAVLTGCSAGERSGYTGEGSFFTRGLADALGPLTSARTVKDVFATASAKALRAARVHGQTQTARIRYGTNAEPETREAEICEGRPLLDAWRAAAQDTLLWKHVQEQDADSVPRFQECLGAFVEECARTLHRAQDRMPHPDPWADDAFPVRLLRDWLPRLLPDAARLSAVEAAALVAAPFLREAAWADRLSQAAEVDPYALERRRGVGAHRRHYEQILDQHARVARKVAECRSRKRTEDEAAVTMWLVHRWVADRFDTDDDVLPAAHADTLARTLLGERGAEQDRVDELSWLLRVTAASIGPAEDLDVLRTHAPGKVLLSTGYQTLRIRPLGALIRLAATLAVDVRVFPEVVAEHLAVTDPVLPQDVIGIAHRMSWEREEDTLHLDAPCPHQAVHSALADIAEEADQLAQQVVASVASLTGPESDLLGAAPIRVTTRDLRPRRTGGIDSYEVPLLRFHLAQTEVRELLMGEQLYGGEPQLALRELYQNAMDACRYRQMRWAYLKSSGARPAEWSGHITITEGKDAAGRRYIECRDNGVGMSEEQLKYTFTRAGSRFEQSKAFRREQSRWLRRDPSLRLYPNSRFGIGVFSYFMLADEMTIVTRQVSPDGIPAERASRVDIPSSGSLFRVQKHDGKDDGLPEGGTRVRLYLRDGVMADGASCVNVLREQVRVSEFRLDVQDATGYAHPWPPGELQAAPGGGTAKGLQSVPGVLWWVDGPGAVLCDGIITDQAPFGYVLNLTGPHAGRLSVSRKELQEFDLGWAEENWRAGATSLAAWPGLSMEWLWELEQRNCPVARVLWHEWRGKGVTATLGRQGERYSLDTGGWFYPDSSLIDRAPSISFDLDVASMSGTQRTAPWRAAALKLPRGESVLPCPAHLVGHPVPEPGDASVMSNDIGRNWRHLVRHAADSGLTLADVMRRQRRLRVVHALEAPRALPPGDLDMVPEEIDGFLAEALARPVHQGQTYALVDDDVREDLAALVLASRHLALPLGMLARRYAGLAQLHGTPAPCVPVHHEHYVCTDEDVEHLFMEPGLAFDMVLRRPRLPQDVREISEATGMAPSQLLSRITLFDWLGWASFDLEEITSWMDLDDDLFRSLRPFTSIGAHGRQVVGLGATVVLAARLRTTLADAEERLAAPAARLGLTHQRHFTTGGGGGVTTPSAYTGELVKSLQRLDQHLENPISLEMLARAAKDSPGNAELQTAVDELRRAEVDVPVDLRSITAWSGLPLPARFALAGKEVTNSGEDYPASEVTAAGLFYAAELLRESLRGAWEHAEQHAADLGVTVPRLPADLASYRPTPLDTRTLTHQPHNAGSYFSTTDALYSTAVWEPLTPLALATYANELAIGTASAYHLLARLRPLGALVPELPTHALDALPDTPPGAHDLVALSPENWLPDESVALTTLGIVSIAAQLGEGIPVALSRLVPYLALLPDVPCPTDPPDIIPLWQDLSLLTEGLNGLQPSLTGQVPPEHITRAARAIGESESWVTDRLRLYASLFDLHFDGLTTHD